jgi:hypothetical protein
MSVAAKPVTELDGERRRLMQSQQERWQQFVNGK